MLAVWLGVELGWLVLAALLLELVQLLEGELMWVPSLNQVRAIVFPLRCLHVGEIIIL